MNFYSILFKSSESAKKSVSMPDAFADLNLDQFVNAVCEIKHEYNIKQFFSVLLDDIDEIRYRQDVMSDLENTDLFNCINLFSQKMHTMNEYLSQSEKSHYKYHKERLFLNAAEIYCDSLHTLNNELSSIGLISEGFTLFKEYLLNYIRSNNFTAFSNQTKTLIDELSQIKYNLLIKSNGITVSRYESEIDFGKEIEKTFSKFQHNGTKDYPVKLPAMFSGGMNHIEAQILEKVARLYPEVFLNLDEYCEQNSHFEDNIIVKFNIEVQFYMAFLEYIMPLKQTGLHFCYPKISDTNKEIYAYETFDLILASKLHDSNKTVVCNDFSFKDNERIFVVTGPNQGGKTTFARTFGQLHYMAKLGFVVPAKQAKLFLFDKLFTHFGKEESIFDLRGKLEDDLVRIHDILNKVTPNSIVIMNEIFNSTTFADAVFLSKKIMEKIIQLDLLCVWVTFIDELSNLNSKIVSMVATVVPENPSLRTHKIMRKPSDGISYAISIALKYHVTYDDIKERIKK